MWAVILVLSFAFYWTQIRPVNIRKACAKKAAKYSQDAKLGLPDTLQLHQAVYSDCLRCNGINK